VAWGVIMPKFSSRCWVFAVLALIFAGAVPVSAAAKIRCNGANAGQSACVQEFAAQARPRITVHPRYRRLSPYAKRFCRFWLATEYRPSGTVITPQQRCWWYVPRR
jgi:hypothetical protein